MASVRERDEHLRRDHWRGGGEEVQCGWLKDRYGVSWQVVPAGMDKVFGDDDPARAARAMTAMLGMKKIDIAALRRAADGETVTADLSPSSRR
ncbi:MAG: VOC family protein [Actinomycetes bacterium]